MGNSQNNKMEPSQGVSLKGSPLIFSDQGNWLISHKKDSDQYSTTLYLYNLSSLSQKHLQINLDSVKSLKLQEKRSIDVKEQKDNTLRFWLWDQSNKNVLNYIYELDQDNFTLQDSTTILVDDQQPLVHMQSNPQNDYLGFLKKLSGSIYSEEVALNKDYGLQRQKKQQMFSIQQEGNQTFYYILFISNLNETKLSKIQDYGGNYSYPINGAQIDENFQQIKKFVCSYEVTKCLAIVKRTNKSQNSFCFFDNNKTVDNKIESNCFDGYDDVYFADGYQSLILKKQTSKQTHIEVWQNYFKKVNKANLKSDKQKVQKPLSYKDDIHYETMLYLNKSENIVLHNTQQMKILSYPQLEEQLVEKIEGDFKISTTSDKLTYVNNGKIYQVQPSCSLQNLSCEVGLILGIIFGILAVFIVLFVILYIRKRMGVRVHPVQNNSFSDVKS